MTGEPVARRHPASAFPEIRSIRLAPPGVAATLVNLSATGILVECASRPSPGSMLTVHFEGTFSPASIRSRVVRCEVAGIGADGSLRYRLGLAFSSRLALPNEVDPIVDARGDAPAASPSPTTASAAVAAFVPRNRW